MLKQASVKDIRTGAVTRRDGYVAITMAFYPRGLKKELRDEYLGSLAPDKALFKDFKRWQAKLGHEEGFRKSRYLRRFKLSQQALAALERLSALGRKRDVYLVCQCAVGERCHREILLLLAKKRFGARVDEVLNDYAGTAALAASAPRSRG
jgi:uncharacterized protein YeaO (DUF488 family)